jgi:hypothetical protein
VLGGAGRSWEELGGAGRRAERRTGRRAGRRGAGRWEKLGGAWRSWEGRKSRVLQEENEGVGQPSTCCKHRGESNRKHKS